MQYPIIDVTNWIVDTEKGEGKGLREKVWLIDPSSGQSAMFKIPRQDRGEHWAEKVCSEIANVLDFNCAKVDIAIREGTYGCLSYFFVDKNRGFSHFDGGTYFPYDYDDEKNIGYNAQLIEEVLDREGISFGEFLFVIIFDALIANGDRHQDNWGITRHDIESEKFISPLYDNSACLGRDLNESQVELFCSSNEALLRYIYKGKSKIGWKDTRNENHFKLVRNVFRYYPLRTKTLLNRLNFLSEEEINNIVTKLPSEVINDKHKEFVVLFLIKRRDILKRIGDKMVNIVNELLLIWKDPSSRQRFTVGKLFYNEYSDIYRFTYLNPDLDEAITHGFKNYPNFPSLNQHYEVKGKLFKDIKSRIPQPRRPDYAEILERYGLDASSTDMEVLEATRGRTATDNFEFVKEFIYKANQEYNFTFDLAGARYTNFNEIASDLKINDSVELQLDKANDHDPFAVKVFAKGFHIGYVPKYYTKEFYEMINDDAPYSANIAKLDIINISPDEWAQIRIKINFE